MSIKSIKLKVEAVCVFYAFHPEFILSGVTNASI